MKIFQKLFKRSSGLDANQQNYLARIAANIDNDYSLGGSHVSIRSGLHQDSVYTAIKRTADSVAKTPVGVFSDIDGQKGRDKLKQHPVYRLLNHAANQDLTSYAWLHLSVIHLLAYGNCFSHIERNAKGDVMGLQPMHPEDVKIEGRDANGGLVYSWTPRQGGHILFRAADVLHIKGLSFDGIVGVSPILQLRSLVGRALDRENFQTQFYRNGAVMGGVITMPDGLTDEQLERHRKSFSELYSGSRNSGKILLLEGTQQYTPLGTTPRDASFIESSKMDRGAIAAVFGLPLTMLNETENVNKSSSEQLFKEWLLLGLDTIFCNIEQQINVTLFSPTEGNLYCEFNRESVGRADTAVLIDALQKQVLSSILTPNEARQMLNLNPQPGGDNLLAAVNLVPLEKLGQTSAFLPDRNPNEAPATPARSVELMPQLRQLAPPKPQKRSRGRQGIIKAALPTMQDAFARIGSRERQDIGKAAKKHLRAQDNFNGFLNDYYAHDSAFSGYFKKTLDPVMRSLRHGVHDQIEDQLGSTVDESGSDFTDQYSDTLLFRYTSSSKRQLRSLLTDLPDDGDPQDAIDERLSQWDNGTTDNNPTRAEKESTNETTRFVNALARTLFAAGGVTKLVWSGGDCPICQDLDGKTVGIEEPFAGDGEELSNDFKNEGDTFHPPLHQGCNCSIDPE